MMAMTEDLNREILTLIRDRGIDGQLKEEQQLGREAERTAILVQIAEQETVDQSDGQRLAAARLDAESRLRDAEARVAAARRDLCEIAAALSQVGARTQRLRFRLAQLADSRIAEALHALSDLSERARNAFKSRPLSSRVNVMGDRVEQDVGNGLAIGDALAAISAARDRLQALQELPRPERIADAVDEIVSPCRDLVRRLVGL